jgi:putative ABC transport system permease protein
MTPIKLAWRGLQYHWRGHLGAWVGTILATMVLAGALQMGAVVRASLQRLALQRLGGVYLALNTGERQVRAAAVSDLAASLFTQGSAALHLRASLSLPDQAGGGLVSGVQLYAVDDEFWSLVAPGRPSPFRPGGEEQVVLSPASAARLGVQPGQTLLLRCERPSLLSRDALLSTTNEATIAMRLVVAGVVPEDAGGRFSLEASQVPPLAAFVSLRYLQDKLAQPGMANLLLLGAPADPILAEDSRAYLAATNAAWKKVAQLSDLGLEFRALPLSRTHELRSRQIFIDDNLAERVMAVAPNALGVFTYFVNELRVGERSTPYSMVTAMGLLRGSQPPDEAKLPATEQPGDILQEPGQDIEISEPFTDEADEEGLSPVDINEWLANDLQAKPGDRLVMRYFVDHASQAFGGTHADAGFPRAERR